MTTRCGWCGALLAGPDGPADSHGTCPDCAVQLLIDGGYSETEARQIVAEETDHD